MHLVLLALAGLLLAAAAPLFVFRRDALALKVGSIGGGAFCALGLAGAVQALLSRQTAQWQGPWGLPIGELRLGLDPLSAFFLCILFVVGLASAVYGGGYLRAWAGKRRVAWSAAGFNALLAATAAVFVARDGVVFLLSWELMSVAAFLLIAFEHEKAEVRSGALWYMIFNHFGVACLFAFFALIGRESGSFALPAAALTLAPPLATALLVLALIGFGTKAGLAPMHIWLPEAHPVAPSHVSAMLSAVLLKAGVYGLLRTLLVVGGVPQGAGWTLVALGAFSGVLGGINLLATSDLKKSLAYSSIENVGIISLAIGLGVVGLAGGYPTVAALGLCGALFHALSHSIFKGLLFTSAGSAVHAAHTRKLDEMGGLARRMPATAFVFLAGAASAAAIPGLAGFASEFFVYRALLEGLQKFHAMGQAMAAGALGALALTGGLAAAGLARAFGIAFSGAPRTESAAHAREQPRDMLVPMAALAAASALIGVLPRLALALIAPVLAQLHAEAPVLAEAAVQAGRIGAVGFTFFALCAALFLLRERLLSGREPATGRTWGCGYALPTPSMQYSATSFASPLVTVLRGMLEVVRPTGPATLLFPGALLHEFGARDRVEVAGWRRALSWASGKLGEIRALHRPRLHFYVVYLFVALLLLLSYAARLGRT